VAAATLLPTTMAGGQGAPTMTVTPLRADPGATISIVIEDCVPDSGRMLVAIDGWLSDTPEGFELTEESPGRWVGSFVPGDDVVVRSYCNGTELRAEVDVERPRMFPTPLIIPPINPPDPPQGFLGTDCPDGTTAHVAFQAIGRPAPEIRTAAIDQRGDWRVTVPDFPRGTAVQVSASCGSVTYPDTTYTAGGSQYATTTTSTTSSHEAGSTTTTTVAASGTSAAPATPVAATAAYTG
jgi:hypothetical protein